MLTEFQTRKWTHLFELYDVDKNGVVSAADFKLKAKEVARVRNIAAGSAEYRELEDKILADWEQLRQTADTSGDGKVELSEWLAHGSAIIADKAMYDTVADEARKVFDIFDRDGDGDIDRDEYITILTAWGAPRKAVEQAFPRLDLNGDGKLSRAEFVQLLRQFHQSDDPNEPGNHFFGVL